MKKKVFREIQQLQLKQIVKAEKDKEEGMKIFEDSNRGIVEVIRPTIKV